MDRILELATELAEVPRLAALVAGQDVHEQLGGLRTGGDVELGAGGWHAGFEVDVAPNVDSKRCLSWVQAQSASTVDWIPVESDCRDRS